MLGASSLPLEFVAADEDPLHLERRSQHESARLPTSRLPISSAIPTRSAGVRLAIRTASSGAAVISSCGGPSCPARRPNSRDSDRTGTDAAVAHEPFAGRATDTGTCPAASPARGRVGDQTESPRSFHLEREIEQFRRQMLHRPAPRCSSRARARTPPCRPASEAQDANAGTSTELIALQK